VHSIINYNSQASGETNWEGEIKKTVPKKGRKASADGGRGADITGGAQRGVAARIESSGGEVLGEGCGTKIQIHPTIVRNGKYIAANGRSENWKVSRRRGLRGQKNKTQRIRR